MFRDSELLDIVWVGTNPRSCALIVVTYCNGGGKQGRKEQRSQQIHPCCDPLLFSLDVL